MVAYTANPAAVGTALVAAAGTITTITVAALPTITDPNTQLALVDAANATQAANNPRTLFAAQASALGYLVEPRPGMPLTPGLTAPTYPKTVANLAISFSNGIWVKSCPAGLTLTVNA